MQNLIKVEGSSVLRTQDSKAGCSSYLYNSGENAKVSGANVVGVTFKDTIIDVREHGIKFIDCTFDNCMLTSCKLIDCKLVNCDLRSCSSHNCVLVNPALMSSIAYTGYVTGCATFSGSNLFNVRFYHAYFSHFIDNSSFMDCRSMGRANYITFSSAHLDHRRYTPVIYNVYNENPFMVSSGCRAFTLAQAVSHWLDYSKHDTDNKEAGYHFKRNAYAKVLAYAVFWSILFSEEKINSLITDVCGKTVRKRLTYKVIRSYDNLVLGDDGETEIVDGVLCSLSVSDLMKVCNNIDSSYLDEEKAGYKAELKSSSSSVIYVPNEDLLYFNKNVK